MKRTIMVIGGGLLQVPVIQCAKDMGYQVIVTDYNPDAMGLKDADIPIIMSTRDIQGSVRVAKQQNELTPIHGVLTVGTDASMTVAAVAQALSLPGIKYEDAEAATNKIKMRLRFKEYGIPSPGFLPVWSLADAKKAAKILGFPIVLKPSDNMGARGVIRIDNMNQISDAFRHAKNASPSGELLMEEFMEGPELSIDAIIYNEEATITGIADRIIEYPPYFVETGHTMPSQLSQKLQDEAVNVMKDGIKALGITTGAAKGDIKITKDGAMIGELAARLSGGFMSAYTYPYATGVNLMKAMIEVALGEEPGNLEAVHNKVSIERAIIPKPGILSKINNLDKTLKIPGVNNIFLNVEPGDAIKMPKSNVEKPGNIIITADSLQQVNEIYEKCKNTLSFDINETPELSMGYIRQKAREKFKKLCYVCKSCDGYDCASGVPGMGGTGTGESFRRNKDALQQYKITTRLIHDAKTPEIKTSIFGINLEIPVMAAPITGSVTNMGGAIEELDYNLAVVKGALDAGTLAFVGDGATPDKYKIGLKAVSGFDGMGIPIFKPRSDNEEIIKRIKAAEKAKAIAVGMDIDAISFKTMAMRKQSVGPKSVAELKELVSSTKLPFILKGIMSIQDAQKAYEAGAKAIIISNHGGRVLDEMAGTMDVLEEITAVVKDKMTILIDGGFRSGVDVFKALALGAHGVLIGRPVSIAAVGAGEKGTKFYFNIIKKELQKAMLLTGCKSLEDINKDLIKKI